MKFRVDDMNEFGSALARVSKAPDESPRVGLGASVRMRASAGMVELFVRDTIVAAVTSCRADTANGGQCWVPIKLLSAVLTSAPEGPVEIERRGENLEFRARGWLRTLCANDNAGGPDFPIRPVSSHAVPAAALRRLLARTSHAAYEGADRPDRACLVVNHQHGRLEARASDGFRAAYAWVAAELDGLPTLVIHQQALRELQQILSVEGTHEILVGLAGEHLFLETPATSIAVLKTLFDPTDLSGWFGKIPTSLARLESMALLRALDSAYEMTGREPVYLTLGSGLVVVHAAESARGSTTDELPAARTGPDVALCVGNRYLRDAVRAIGDEEIRLGVSGPTEPLVVLPANEQNAEVMVMPMR
jgi:DNA polymerase III subunit beta